MSNDLSPTLSQGRRHPSPKSREHGDRGAARLTERRLGSPSRSPRGLGKSALHSRSHTKVNTGELRRLSDCRRPSPGRECLLWAKVLQVHRSGRGPVRRRVYVLAWNPFDRTTGWPRWVPGNLASLKLRPADANKDRPSETMMVGGGW